MGIKRTPRGVPCQSFGSRCDNTLEGGQSSPERTGLLIESAGKTCWFAVKPCFGSNVP